MSCKQPDCDNCTSGPGLDYCWEHGFDERAEYKSAQSSFAVLVKGWLERCDVTDAELAKAFDISRPSCARWRSGQCAVHPAMREHLRVFFEARLATTSGGR